VLAGENRITSGVDYRRLVRTGRRITGDLTICSARASTPEAPLRMGVIVTRKVGNAVVRNRVRRRIKAIGWQLATELTGIDVVVRALPASASASWVTLEAEVRSSVHGLAVARGQRRRQNAPSAGTDQAVSRPS
jgi:ribonuclease P protein component